MLGLAPLRPSHQVLEAAATHRLPHRTWQRKSPALTTVLRALRYEAFRGRSIGYTQLSRRAGISRSTISTYVQHLYACGLERIEQPVGADGALPQSRYRWRWIDALVRELAPELRARLQLAAACLEAGAAEADVVDRLQLHRRDPHAAQRLLHLSRRLGLAENPNTPIKESFSRVNRGELKLSRSRPRARNGLLEQLNNHDQRPLGRRCQQRLRQWGLQADPLQTDLAEPCRLTGEKHPTFLLAHLAQLAKTPTELYDALRIYEDVARSLSDRRANVRSGRRGPVTNPAAWAAAAVRHGLNRLRTTADTKPNANPAPFSSAREAALAVLNEHIAATEARLNEEAER